MLRDELLFDLADWLTTPPSGGRVQMWAVGAVFATIVFAYGMNCCVTENATTLNITTKGFRAMGRGPFLDIDGDQAFSFGLVVICAGCFSHFQWFWGNHPRLVNYHEIGKCVALAVLLAAAAWHVFTMIVLT